MLTSAWLLESVFKKHKVDSIISMNWVCTMLTLRGLRQLEKQLGRDVHMISFDDIELADMLTPGISAVCQPAERFDTEAAKLLFRRLKGEALERRISVVLPTNLILRESCGCTRLPSLFEAHSRTHYAGKEIDRDGLFSKTVIEWPIPSPIVRGITRGYTKINAVVTLA